MYRFVLMICLLSILAASISAQEHQNARVYFHGSQRHVSYEVVFGSDMRAFLFKQKNLTRYIGDEKPSFQPILRSLLAKRVTFFLVRDYTLGSKRIVQRRGNKVEITVTNLESHPPRFPAAAVGRKLFVFGVDSVDEDVKVFNSMVKELGLTVDNPDEAKAIIELFEYLHGFPPLSKRSNILTAFADIPEIFRRSQRISLGKAAEIAGPHVKFTSDKFELI